MTTERDFDRIARWFLADGPDRLADRVLDAALDDIHDVRQRPAARRLWRFPTMSAPARLAAIAVVAALAVLGSLMLIGGFGSPPFPTVPSTIPSPAVAPSIAPTIGALDTRFTSARNGYQVMVPSGWTTVPATAPWSAGKTLLWGDPALDSLRGPEARLVASIQAVPAGTAPEAWYRAYCVADGATATACADVPGRWPRIKIGGTDAYLTLDGERALPGTIVPGGRIFDAVVATGRHAYAFTLDGNVDRSTFEAILDTVILMPSIAVDLPELTDTFTSAQFGFSVPVAPDWLGTPGTGDLDKESGYDYIAFTGTDTTAQLSSQPLVGQTFADYLTARHDEATAVTSDIPQGCDGGDPSTWPEVAMGNATGRLQQLCNAAVAYAAVDGRAYTVFWGNSTFDTAQHLSEVAWKAWLADLVFDPSSAKH